LKKRVEIESLNVREREKERERVEINTRGTCERESKNWEK
jgi:uncharacterized beta-barrel protein YwiB (DUF1934 family)